jgi:hypothetical protein
VHVGDGVFETRDHAVRVRFEVTGGAITRVLLASDDAILTFTPEHSASPAEAPVPVAPTEGLPPLPAPGDAAPAEPPPAPPP